MSNIDQAIQENATGPKKASGDSGSVEMHSIKDQIAADNHMAAKRVAKKGMKGLIRQRAVPPGTA